jgi:hypothetical protein
LKQFLINLKNSYTVGKRIIHDTYFKSTSDQTQAEIKKRPRRSAIINFLMTLSPAKNYLEIGVRNPEKNFNKINCKNKFSVDPGIEFKENPVDYKMTSDEFFEKMREGTTGIDIGVKFDVIFIDGLHIANQVEKDILNALDFISDTGFIVLHDCNPPSQFHARESYDFQNSPAGSFWNGTTWKAFYKFRHNKNLFSICFDTDWGVGVISQTKYAGFNNLSLPIENPYYEYNIHSIKKSFFMNLYNFDVWKKEIK